MTFFAAVLSIIQCVFYSFGIFLNKTVSKDQLNWASETYCGSVTFGSVVSHIAEDLWIY